MEQLVALLCEELVRRGHEVTLFATGDSTTTAELRSYFDRGYEHDDELWDWQFTEYMHVGYAYSQAEQFDVMHCHSYHFGLPFAPFVRKPNIHTHHVQMEPGVIEGYRRFPAVNLVAVSRFQQSLYGGRPNLSLIHHGIETAAFPFGEGHGGHLLFLGRMIRDKGPLEAIKIARQLDMPLILAGPEEEGFEENVAPHIDGTQVTYVGRVGPVERNRLLAGASALLYPLLYPEPFGLVVVEAMACGTPVVAVGIGAVPELVEPGLTGVLAPSWEGLAAVVPEALALDRRAIRARAVERFDYTRMVDEHEALYHRLVHERPAPR
ncbi:MAG TPA: glycosyltransferase family 4 protein [Solirubrobacteraceae bacterium]|nr:glycosyltransferase family 4 protein [Solirubrobacteraceae bacterium]